VQSGLADKSIRNRSHGILVLFLVGIDEAGVQITEIVVVDLAKIGRE
jgi:hypothetical protein